MDAMLERLERLEQAARAAERRARAWQLAAGVTVGIGLLLLPLQSGSARGGQSQQGGLPAVERRVAALDATVTALKTTVAAQGTQITLEEAQNFTQVEQIAALQDKLVHVSRSGNDLYITGANLHLRNGMEATATRNSLGNLIVGYNEPYPFPGFARTGSHNLIVGSEHAWDSYGGLVAGRLNIIAGPYASVSGGTRNLASGQTASVSGGENNLASGETAAVSGGVSNLASGRWASVSGGLSVLQSSPAGWSGGSQAPAGTVQGNFRSP